MATVPGSGRRSTAATACTSPPSTAANGPSRSTCAASRVGNCCAAWPSTWTSSSENFRPGVLAEMGLDQESLAEDNPGVIVMSVSGFGPTGPEQFSPGLDQVAQGMSGLMSVTGARRPHADARRHPDHRHRVRYLCGTGHHGGTRGPRTRWRRPSRADVAARVGPVDHVVPGAELSEHRTRRGAERQHTPDDHARTARSTRPISPSSSRPARTGTGSRCARFSGIPNSPTGPNTAPASHDSRTAIGSPRNSSNCCPCGRPPNG